jgi:hypothetical protein
VREAELLEKLSDIGLMKVDPEPLGDDTLEVDPPRPPGQPPKLLGRIILSQSDR